jgi:hypothetical protein
MTPEQKERAALLKGWRCNSSRCRDHDRFNATHRKTCRWCGRRKPLGDPDGIFGRIIRKHYRRDPPAD